MIEEKENDPETDFPIKTEEDAGLLDFKYKWLVVRKLSIRRKLGYCARIEVYCTVLSEYTDSLLSLLDREDFINLCK